ncbi:MAG: hypothetical protein K8T20_18155 [Planctomycetes bacterium]|nr:hypothetical protein [Planctomycetota bacterium]
MNLGIDIGRVIISNLGADGREDTSFIGGSMQDALATPPMPGAFEAIGELVRAFDQRVWLISKCGPSVQQKTRRWLDHTGFFEATGVRRDRLVFCLERPQKAVHCARLGITHFIDDRLDVLEAMRGTVPHLFLFGPQRRPIPGAGGFTPVRDWPTALAAVHQSFPHGSAAKKLP